MFRVKKDKTSKTKAPVPSAENSGKTAVREMPKGKPFQPGVCPNPGGRPKSATFNQAVREGLAGIDPADPEGRARADVIFDKVYEKAREGNLEAATFLIERAEGRPMQVTDSRVQLSTNDKPFENWTDEALAARRKELQAVIDAPAPTADIEDLPPSE